MENYKLADVIKNNMIKKISIWWLSFRDNGGRFQGVVMVRAYGLAQAIDITHSLGINPGGEVQAHVVTDRDIRPELLNRLLSEDELKKSGLME